MTLLELQKVLGERIEIAKNKELSSEQKKEEIETSDIVARLAKQMINNADIILRTDKMRQMNGVKNTAISEVVGYGKESI